MLILTRKPQQRVLIQLPDGRKGAVHIDKTPCGALRLCLDFPKDIKLRREELEQDPNFPKEPH